MKCLIFRGVVVFLGLITYGCTQWAVVPYRSLEETNYVKVMLKDGQSAQGTIVKSELHQLTLTDFYGTKTVVASSDIQTINLKPPVKDDYGNGISENEIQLKKSGKNAIVYGIGGGALTFGMSFFAGSLIANSVEDNGGIFLGATTIGCTALSSWLFVRGGKQKDRKVAIDAINNARRESTIIKRETPETSPDDFLKQLEVEKQKREELRKKREELLRQLDSSKAP